MQKDRMKLGLAVVLSLAAIAIPSAQGRQDGGLIRIVAVTHGRAAIDVGREGRSAGDMTFVGSTLFDRHGRTIGYSTMQCTFQGRIVLKEVSLCTAVFVLPRGKIICEGTRSRRDYYVLPVIGGTGLYSNNQGTLIAETESLHPRRSEHLFFSLQ